MSNTGRANSETQPVPAFLSIGLRPFFLSGAIWAAFAMILWTLAIAGYLDLPSRFDPISWHAHAFLFGYLGAIIAGFLLTAIPNWTGRPPLVGLPLLGLVLIWGIGRGAVATSTLWPVVPVAILDLSFPAVLGIIILREIIMGQNWRNLIIVVMLAVFAIANLIFHIEAAHGGYAAQGLGLRLGLAASVMMISVIGGRVVPSFTRNWFKKTGRDLQVPDPMQKYDKITLSFTLVALATWVVLPDALITGIALLVLAAGKTARLVRWKGHYTTAEPLVLVLHAGYAFVPLGALTLGLGLLWPSLFGLAASQHIWMAGAIGLMTLAVMTRATLGHTGRELHAGAGTVVIYGTLVVSVVARFYAGIWPSGASLLYLVSGLFWIIAFGGFALIYGRHLIGPRA